MIEYKESPYIGNTGKGKIFNLKQNTGITKKNGFLVRKMRELTEQIRHKFYGKIHETRNHINIRQILWSVVFTFYLKKSKKIQKLIDFNS